MRIRFIYLTFLSFALIVTGCSSRHPEDNAFLLPYMEEPVDPADIALREAVKTFLTSTEAPAASGYDFRRVDLDGDGRRDGLVLLKTPYGYWCGMHGCAMLVFKAGDESFTLVNAIQPIREPLYVSSTETNGWKDLVVRVSGRWDEAKDVAMQFDGTGYPDNPSNLPPYLRFAAVDTTRLFYE